MPVCVHSLHRHFTPAQNNSERVSREEMTLLLDRKSVLLYWFIMWKKENKQTSKQAKKKIKKRGFYQVRPRKLTISKQQCSSTLAALPNFQSELRHLEISIAL